jgi:hypothetical protein
VRSTTRFALASALHEEVRDAWQRAGRGVVGRIAGQGILRAARGRACHAAGRGARAPRVAGQRVDERAARDAQPDRAQVLQVTGQGRLSDLHSALGQQVSEFLL